MAHNSTIIILIIKLMLGLSCWNAKKKAFTSRKSVLSVANVHIMSAFMTSKDIHNDKDNSIKSCI